MKEYINVLKKSKFFEGINDDDVISVLHCLNAKIKKYDKSNFVFNDGDEIDFIGIILSGEVQTQKIDYEGNINIIAKIYPSDIIAASACCSTDKRLPFDILCLSDCDILCLDITSLMKPCCNACTFHTHLIKNLIQIISDRNIIFSNKIDILTKRTTRDKVLTFLYAKSKEMKNKDFTIMLNRKQMAEYLSVDRSALSKELMILSNLGKIEFKKNHFLLK